MSWWLAAGAAISAVGKISAGNKAKDLSDKNADLAWQQTLEEVRRLEDQSRQNLGTMDATVGGSGVKMSGSVENYRGYVEREQQAQADYLYKAGEQQAKVIREGGDAAWYKSALSGTSDAVSAWGYADKAMD